MIEDLNNPDIIDAALLDEGTSELERELAYRLQCAIDEIDVLVKLLHTLEAKHGIDT